MLIYRLYKDLEGHEGFTNNYSNYPLPVGMVPTEGPEKVFQWLVWRQDMTLRKSSKRKIKNKTGGTKWVQVKFSYPKPKKKK